MQLTRTQRKFILLYARLIELARAEARVADGVIALEGSPRAFVWKHAGARGREHAPEHIAEVDYLRKHRTAASPRANTEQLDALDEIVPRLFPADWPTRPVSNRAQGVFSFGERIGIPRARGRYMIDQEHSRQVPTYSFAAMKPAAAEEFVEHYGGVYHLYRHDVNAVTREHGHLLGMLLRATLSIRYPVSYIAHDSKNQGDQRVRCKLNVPAYNGRAPFFKYDGYVVPRGKRWCWLFQTRHEDDEFSDLILMYTDAPRAGVDVRDAFRKEGSMFTQNQEADLVPTASKVVLAREPGWSVCRESTQQTGGIELPKQDVPAYLDAYIRANPTDERDFMRGRCSAIDLKDLGSRDDLDRSALDLLFHGGAGQVNTATLHQR